MVVRQPINQQPFDVYFPRAAGRAFVDDGRPRAVCRVLQKEADCRELGGTAFMVDVKDPARRLSLTLPLRRHDSSWHGASNVLETTQVLRRPGLFQALVAHTTADNC